MFYIFFLGELVHSSHWILKGAHHLQLRATDLVLSEAQTDGFAQGYTQPVSEQDGDWNPGLFTCSFLFISPHSVEGHKQKQR